MFFESNEIRVCPRHDEQVPLIWTFAFPGSEYWCPACGYTHGMMGAGISVPSTPDLEKAKEEWGKIGKEYLDANGTLTCDEMKIDGLWVKREDIPDDIVEKARNTVDTWKYKYGDSES